MKIDFNNVRKMAISNYSALVEKLNNALNSGNGKGMVVISAEEIKRNLDDLRSDLVAIGATYQPNDDDFKCIIGDEPLPVFNEDPEYE